jgi:YidC/Oxa1 family membrane protein insertase
VAFFSEIGVLFQAIFTQPIFNALMLLYRLFGDFGLSIIVLTLIIKLVLFPLTLQQLKSAKANQALQPQMQEIRRKYAKDQQAQAMAIQALYKEYGINPMAGCLPLLIQLPVLYGMYFAFSTVLNSPDIFQQVSGLLYPFVQGFAHFTRDTLNAHTLSLNWFIWLKFLQPAWPWSISLAKPDPTHILPIIAAVATFVQLRMSLPKTAPTSTKAKPAQPDPTTSTMKTMQYVMPFFTLFIGWSLPCGLALYWTVSSIFQAVQQYFVTGWGSLLIKPDVLLKKEGVTTSTSSNGALASRKENVKESVKEKAPVEDDEDDKRPVATAASGAVASKMRSTNGPRPSSNGSSSQSSARRSRNGSASARRRNTQRPRR